MRHMLVGAVPVLTVVVGACGAPDTNGTEANPRSAVTTEQLVRTADPNARGYTDADFPRVQELAPGVYSYEQLRSAGDETFTTVSLFVVTDDGVLVADGQGSVAETERLVDHIASVTDQPIRTVVICSDHGDHTAGNAAFPPDVTFLAHPASVAALEAGRREGGSSVAPPITPVEEREVLQMGGREIHVLFLGRAHTGGDLVVYLPTERIMFMSEAYLHRIFPAMRTAYPSEWVEMIERAQAMDVDVYVPGHGFVDSPQILDEELEVFQDAIRTVIAEATRLHGEGYALEEAQVAAAFGELESWTLRSSQAPRALQQVYAEIEGTLPGSRP